MGRVWEVGGGGVGGGRVAAPKQLAVRGLGRRVFCRSIKGTTLPLAALWLVGWLVGRPVRSSSCNHTTASLSVSQGSSANVHWLQYGLTPPAPMPTSLKPHLQDLKNPTLNYKTGESAAGPVHGSSRCASYPL